jgi:hypothetical protein
MMLMSESPFNVSIVFDADSFMRAIDDACKAIAAFELTLDSACKYLRDQRHNDRRARFFLRPLAYQIRAYARWHRASAFSPRLLWRWLSNFIDAQPELLPNDPTPAESGS